MPRSVLIVFADDSNDVYGNISSPTCVIIAEQLTQVFTKWKFRCSLGMRTVRYRMPKADEEICLNARLLVQIENAFFRNFDPFLITHLFVNSHCRAFDVLCILKNNESRWKAS